MAKAVFEPGKALGGKIAEMDKQELCMFVSALCRTVVAEVGSRGRRGGLYPENISVGADGAIAIGPMLAVRRESTGGRGRCEPHVLEAVEIIRREACDGLTVAQLAKRLPGSRRLLDLRFREAMGHSVHDEILQVRLERVFDLLRRPEMRIGAIADFSGFALHQLDKVFRARFGCSLRDWRKRNVKP